MPHLTPNWPTEHPSTELARHANWDLGRRDDVRLTLISSVTSLLSCPDLGSWRRSWIWLGPHPSTLLLAELSTSPQQLIRWRCGQTTSSTDLFPFQPKVPSSGAVTSHWQLLSADMQVPGSDTLHAPSQSGPTMGVLTPSSRSEPPIQANPDSPRSAWLPRAPIALFLRVMC